MSSLNDDSRVVTGDSSVTLQFVVSLTDDSRGIFYNYNMFIVQAIARQWWRKKFYNMRPMACTIKLFTVIINNSVMYKYVLLLPATSTLA